MQDPGTHTNATPPLSVSGEVARQITPEEDESKNIVVGGVASKNTVRDTTDGR